MQNQKREERVRRGYKTAIRYAICVVIERVSVSWKFNFPKLFVK